jgi:type III secretion protein U
VSTEKTEPASSKKLESARNKGQVAHSRDLSSAFAFFFAMAALMATGSASLDHVRNIIHEVLSISRPEPEQLGASLYAHCVSMVIDGLWVTAPVLIAAMIGAVVGGMSHVGMLMSFEPLVPKFDSIDPVNGMKRIFSVRSLVEVLKMAVKAVIIGWVLYVLIRSVAPMLLRSSYGSFESIGKTAWDTLLRLFAVCSVLFLLMGVVDFVIQRLMFLKQQKMSKDEVKREYKEAEGDPHMKGARHQLAHEIAFSDPKPAVATANAVVVNPTHYAVALHYDPEGHGLPVVVAKGVDEAAARIRELAQAHGVPIIRNPELARALYKLPVPAMVPEPLLEAVAIVLRWADQMRCTEPAC